MAENLLALQVRPLDVATPLLQARRIQQSEMQARQAEQATAQSQFQLRQAEMGAEFRGLTPYVNHPEFGQRWGEAMDRLASRGILPPDKHAQLRNSPSPLLLQQGLAMTSSTDQMIKMQQMARTRAADSQFGPELYGGAPGQPSAAAPPVAPAPVAGQPDNMTIPAPQVAAANGLPAPAAPQPNNPVTFGDGVTVNNPPLSSPMAPATPPAQPVQPPSRGAMTQDSPDQFVAEVNRLSRIAANPDVSKRVAEVAQLRLKTLLEQSNDWKNYQRARASGDPAATKPFTEWLMAVKRSGSTLINTTEGTDAAAQRARITLDLEGAKESQKQALTGIRLLPMLNEVERLATRTPGGWAGPISATAARGLAALGLPVDEKYSNAEVLQSISQRLVPIVREPGPTSERELEVYLRAVPGLMQSPEGRMKVVAMTRAMVDRSRQIAKVYRDNIGKPDLVDKLAALDKPIIPASIRKDIETAASAPAAPTVPQVGEVREGWEFLGGNPADPKSWKDRRGN